VTEQGLDGGGDISSWVPTSMLRMCWLGALAVQNCSRRAGDLVKQLYFDQGLLTLLQNILDHQAQNSIGFSIMNARPRILLSLPSRFTRALTATFLCWTSSAATHNQLILNSIRNGSSNGPPQHWCGKAMMYWIVAMYCQRERGGLDLVLTRSRMRRRMQITSPPGRNPPAPSVLMHIGWCRVR
jgi:hypothetical protein